MKKRTKLFLIIGASLLIAGAIIHIGAMSMLNFNYLKLDSSKYEDNFYELSESFDDLRIITSSAEILILPSENGERAVRCYENVKMPHKVSFEDGALKIECVDGRKWYDYISIFAFKTPKIEVYLPEGEYGELFIKSSTGKIDISDGFTFESVEAQVSTADVICMANVKNAVRIKATTGNVRLENISASSVDVAVSTGSVNISSVSCDNEMSILVSTGKTKLVDVSCGSLRSKGNTGDITLKHVVASGDITIKRSTGSVRFEGADAENLDIKTDTGNIKGNLYTDKKFVYSSDTGDVRLPETTSGGLCRVETDTGDIIITISK